MSISLSNFLIKLNNYLGDTWDSTTTSIGNTAKTTFVDSTMTKYADDYFSGGTQGTEWWVYLSSQLRAIKDFTSSSGTFEVYNAFSAQVPSLTAYSLHKFDRNKKIVACNQALNAAYPLYHNRIEDATTLDGKGASDNEYTVPVAFVEFPDQIWQKHTSSTVITYTPITDFEVMEITGTMKFYANITLGDDIVLVGKKYLTQFTNDASTTELTDAEASVVALLAAAIFHRSLSEIVNAADSGRFDSLANRFEQMYEEKKLQHAMPVIAPRTLDWGWL